MRCVHGDYECIPSGHEMVNRAKKLFGHVLSGSFLHNDHAKYQLSLQSNVYGGRCVLGRKEMADVMRRISSMVVMFVPLGDLGALPECIKDHVGEHPTYKIEWMYNGRYGCTMSESYARNFISEKRIMGVCKEFGIPPKLVDMVGLNEYGMAYKMWCESLFNPGVNISYTGSGYWCDDRKVVYTTARMMSVIVNHEYIITATTAGRGSKFVFGELK
jgi:hypothetical protein